MEHAALDTARVFHANHHAGEQAFKHAGRREVIGRPDLFQVDHHGGGRLGAIHHIPTHQPLGIAEDILANPCGWQIGQHIFIVRQVVKVGPCLGAVDQRVVGMHHTLGVACGARCKEHRSNIICMAFIDLLLIKIRMLFGEDFASGQ